MMLDVGKRADERLRIEQVIWLTTVGRDGTPHPKPVWFLWDGETILIYSQPNTHKLRHIERNPRVALNFDSDGRGGDIVVITGTAEVDERAPRADKLPPYVDKYREAIKRIGHSAESMAEEYSVPIRVRPSGV